MWRWAEVHTARDKGRKGHGVGTLWRWSTEGCSALALPKCSTALRQPRMPSFCSLEMFMVSMADSRSRNSPKSSTGGGGGAGIVEEWCA